CTEMQCLRPLHPCVCVFCEMLADGGWTVFQWRFGNLQKDHWLGLSKVFAITKGGGTAFAEYSDFRLGTEEESYKLNVGAYRGIAGNGEFQQHKNGFGFSTTDKDIDGCSPCIFGDIAENTCSFSEGGWWYSRCGSASLNGDWHPAGEHIGWASGLHWATWKGPAPYSARASRMMIKAVWKKIITAN
uniref:Fibrinogen C-terminal domain-containing protein n=1 Tax=Oncorhynchus tshawytscha TaxID=74940 RepID=A0A8C8CG15_ONCTS